MNETICKMCKNTFYKSNYKQIYCTDKCYNKSKNNKRKKKKCESCDSIINKKSKICRQCFLKQKKKRFCCKCNTPILANKYCQSCVKKKIDSGFDYTLEEATYTLHHKSSAFALVRTRARTVARKLKWNKCKNCGYDKHIEIAHIKPISSFSSDTKLSIINDELNLIPLCPNCHWEYDNGILILH